jgi:CheY-like chemotaxis protein
VIRERRRHTRIATKGTVVMHVAGTAHNGRIVDIAEGGVSVVTHVTPPERWLARVIDVELRFDGASAEWLRGKARVMRIRADGLALAFDEAHVPLALARVLGELGDASHTRRRMLAVVLIDSDASRRSAMVAGFRAAGCAIVEAATPLEAIVRLGESSFEPDVIAIADSQPAASADDLRAFARQHHPHVKLVTIVDEKLGPETLRSWVSSSDPDADLPRRIRDVLTHVLLTTRS